MIETFLTILSVVERTTHLYDWFTGLSSGRKRDENLNKIGSDVIVLSDNLIYAPRFVQAINTKQNISLSDGKRIYDMMNPVADALNTDLLVGAVNATPEKLRKAFKKDPWEVLIDVRPADRTKRPSNPDLIAVTFVDREIPYIGWQTRGALPILLDCEFDPNGDILAPSQQDGFFSDSGESARLSVIDSPGFKADLLAFLRHGYPSSRLYFGSIAAEFLSQKIGLVHSEEQNEIIALLDCSLSANAAAFLAFGMKGIYYKNLRGTFQSAIGFITYEEFARVKITKGVLPTIYIGNRHLIDISAAPFDKDTMAVFLIGIQQIVKRSVIKAVKNWEIP